MFAARRRAGARSCKRPVSRSIERREAALSELVLVEIADAIATITLNRPEKRNAMNDEMRNDLIAALEAVAADATIRALVLTGAGKGFCAGGDIAGMQQ